jgi:tellurite resistance protein TerC
MHENIIFFALFLVLVLGILLLDLLVIGRRSHEVPVREAAAWSAVWILLALGFALFLRFFAQYVHSIETLAELKAVAAKYYPNLALDATGFRNNLEIFRKECSINFISGYLIEWSLSVDNLFVIMAILGAFSVRKKDYKRILFWGILGAVVMRFIFIFAGAALVYRLEWVLYIFGAYLIYAGIRMYLDRHRERRIEPQNHPVVKFLSGRFKVFPRYVDDRFFVRKEGVFYLTPLFVVLMIIEFTDLIFATDSIPAIFAVTRDPYIVFFSNIFAILGLRSLFFLLVRVVEKFHLLKIGVAILLCYVGIKLMLHVWLDRIGFKPVYSLYVILAVLIGSILLSLLFPPGRDPSDT